MLCECVCISAQYTCRTGRTPPILVHRQLHLLFEAVSLIGLECYHKIKLAGLQASMDLPVSTSCFSINSCALFMWLSSIKFRPSF